MNDLKAIYFRDIYNDHISEILKEIFYEKLYFPIFNQFDKPSVVDLGANIGLFTYFASMYESTILAVEPAKIHFETLNKMIEFNKLKNVRTVNAAISSRNGEQSFYHNPNTTAYSLSELIPHTKDTETVRLMDLKTLYDENEITKVDVLKVDVEGEEMKIFTSKGFKDVVPMTRSIIVEYHEWCGATEWQMRALLTDYGYTVKQLQTDAKVYYAEKI